MRKIILLAVGIAAICANASAQDEVPKLRASCDKKIIYIGDEIKYTITVKTNENTDIAFPALKDGIGDFEVKASVSPLARRTPTARIIEKVYTITTYSTGKKTIPAVDVNYRIKGSGDWLAKKTAEIPINVVSALPSGATAKDIKDIKKPLSFFSYGLIITAILLAVILGLIATLLIYRMRNRPVKQKTPYELACEELGTIGSLMSGRDLAKEFYVRVSDCVRRYIENAIDLHAPEMTTEEFLGSLGTQGRLSDRHKELLRFFLSACDLVKFAKYTPSREEIKAVFSSARNFIEETK